MRILHEKYRVLLGIGLVLFSGFFAGGMAAFLISVNAERQGVVERALPLTSDAILAELRAELMRPVQAASLLSGDNRLRSWLVEGETDSAAIARVLDDAGRNLGMLGIHIASERTRTSRNSAGELLPLQENGTRDAWYFRLREAGTPVFTGISAERAQAPGLAFFGAARISDLDGSFLGAVGVTMSTDRLMRAIEVHRQRYGSRVYFVDARRRLIPAGASTALAADTIDAAPGLRDIARDLLRASGTPVALQYRKAGTTVFVNARFMPELGWHLLVERDDEAVTGTAQHLLASSLLIGAGVTMLIMVLMLLAVNRYHERLERMAGSDALTGLLNRQAFDIVFRQALLESDRNGRPLSGILFDVDFIRQVNEIHGYAAGDEVLRTIARIARAMLRESDVLTRWNGEEFFVLLKECPIEQAVAIAEKIRQEIDQHDFSAVVADGHITVSLGVAQHEPGETASLFLTRTDEALFKAKANGRNRLHVARGASTFATEAPGAA
ncbi:MAG TPA: sensor domain-containing diguanylate cyclase [Noviherbaspirillum sp.]